MEFVEIIGGNGLEMALSDNFINALRTYKGKEYEVWELSEVEFEKLKNIKEEDWLDEYGWYRHGGAIISPTEQVVVNGNKLYGYENESLMALVKEGEEVEYGVQQYKSLKSHISEATGCSNTTNFCALVSQMAKCNKIKISKLFELCDN